MFTGAAFSATDIAAQVPPPWLNQDVGTVGAPGSATYDAGTFTVSGSGTDIWSTSDQFHYVYQPLSGDGTIIARVVSQENTDGYAKAGVMIRETLDTDSRFAMTVITPENGVLFQHRPTPGVEVVNVSGDPVAIAPFWVSLVRTGDTFFSYSSPDGLIWTLVGSTTVTMNAEVFVGLPVTSHNDGILCEVVFDNVSVSGGADLSIDVSAAPEPVAPGATLTYTLTVANAGPADATDITVTDNLPAGTGFLSASGTGWDCSGSGPVICTLPTLGIATADPITISVTTPPAEGQIVNNATVSSSTSDAIPANNSEDTTSNVSADADLSIIQFGAPSAVCPGQPITYTLIVSNAGPAEAVSVEVSDTIPAGAVLVSATGSGWSCSGTTVVTCTLPTLAVGDAPAISVVVDAPSTPGIATNTASVSSSSNDPLLTNNSSEASTTINPIPSAPTASNSGPICAGETLELFATFVAGGTYSWTGPNGFVSTDQNPTIPSATPAASGLYSVTVTVDGCTSPAGTTTATVHPAPTAVVSGTATICQGDSTQIQAALTGTSPWTVTWSDGAVQSGVVTSPAVRTVNPSSTTTYTVIALSDANCSGSASGSAVVTVGDPVSTPVLTAPLSVPVGATGLTASVPSHPGSTYAWTLTGGTITGGQGTAEITFDAGDPGTTMILEVVETNTSCSSPAASAKIQVDFLDVPPAHEFHDFVSTLARNGVTVGCGNGNYCPDASVTRAEMAVFLLKSKFGSDHVPPTAVGGVFNDVQPGDFAADWIEELASLGITAGCGNGNYCPNAPVTRGEMAVFLLKTLLGSGYVPPPAAGIFEDVPPDYFSIDWIEDLYNRQITGGCLADPLRYCPDDPNTRGQMAVFLVITFGLS